MGQPLAADCRFLRRTMDSAREDGPLVCLCTHPVRDGFDCIGPFLEDLPTECGFWEDGRHATRPPHRPGAATAARRDGSDRSGW